MKKNPILIIPVLYAISVACFAFYWANNFERYVHFKGDGFLVCVTFMILITYAALLLLQFKVLKIRLILLLSLPILIAFASIFSGFLILYATGIEGTSVQDICLYCMIYSLVSLLFIKLFWASPRVQL